MMVYKTGLDVGSTTAKIVVVDDNDNIVFSTYQRHNADIKGTVKKIFSDIKQKLGNISTKFTLTGSAAMGLAERCGLSFVQEVVALTNFALKRQEPLHTIIDIGGEDAKIIFLEKDSVPDMRMNGNCAGGTGAFIDQMSVILNKSIQEMDALAKKSEKLFPIASRCGVFSKTDVQNLVAKNVPTEDICASIFHAVAVQVVSALSRGKQIKEKILFAGGPLTFISSLRESFLEYLGLKEDSLVQTLDNNLLVAKGCTYNKNTETLTLEEIETKLDNEKFSLYESDNNNLPQLFSTKEDYEKWKQEKLLFGKKIKTLKDYKGKAWLGIDSGSTTTKITLCDENEDIIFAYYNKNEGNPVQAVIKGLQEMKKEIQASNSSPIICGGCSTGYGEDLIKAAFSFQSNVVETIAHYTAAKRILPNVDFILDIGGQDMKALYVDNGVLSRIELNEACSSGCGTFIETFANGLGYNVSDFAQMAMTTQRPCDLGTRCTVFMNSKVKQFLREGRTVSDISAGLSYSVVRNCLYKVLKLEGKSLGENIVVQGGTMKNDSVVRALEKMLNRKVYRSERPELMGAYGCSLIAKEKSSEESLSLDEMINADNFTTKQITCRGCENNCLITTYHFANKNVFHSGNRCEKIFSSSSRAEKKGENIYDYKFKRLFEIKKLEKPSTVIGIPRVLNMFEDFPFWETLFSVCNIQVRISNISNYTKYEKSLNQIMSENICFPAKLVHSHIDNLIQEGVNHIFFPYVVYEESSSEKENNTYNCPIVSSYNVVIKHLKDKPEYKDVQIDSPVFSLKDRELLRKNCYEYLSQNFSIDKQTFAQAFEKALKAKRSFEKDLYEKNKSIYEEAIKNHQIVILLAGRPYHTDDLIQHSLSNIATDMGVAVINEDIARFDELEEKDKSFIVSQWSYINRIERGAFFVAKQDNNVQYAQMTSFGCGPDAFLLDDVQDILQRHHKSATFLKIDDIQNPGSLKLRLRSMIESIKLSVPNQQPFIAFKDTKDFSKEEKHRKILAPFFTEYISPFLPDLFAINGYDLEVLPKSDKKSAEEGLKYANNEVCYPATLIVGDAVKALKSGDYNRENIAFGITQTGGQCRATNYYAILRKAFVDAGYEDVPILSVSFGGDTSKKQDGFQINWRKTLPILLATILFGDSLSRLYCSTMARVKDKQQVEDLQDSYIQTAKQIVRKRDVKGMQELLKRAVKDFSKLLPNEYLQRKKVGIVGEIYLKYHSFANHDVQRWLLNQDIEVVPPSLLVFFIQTFVNRKVNKENNIEKQSLPQFVLDFIYKLVKKQVDKYNKIMSEFKYYQPLDDVFELSEKTKKVIPLYTQFGEGWLLPAEIVNMVEHGINTVVSLQPFGCIANHIISKGVENRIKELYPKLNYLALDFDSSVSQVNIKNRLLLMLENI
ncbi:MAG: 2-hydroxyacyl-CoA dehydratase [Bacteroidales bacterium]|nr:2-hydroxyacyl-CoA dehydratase [Bacteroidales bacterium]